MPFVNVCNLRLTFRTQAPTSFSTQAPEQSMLDNAKMCARQVLDKFLPYEIGVSFTTTLLNVAYQHIQAPTTEQNGHFFLEPAPKTLQNSRPTRKKVTTKS